jgi:hypothetical protein
VRELDVTSDVSHPAIEFATAVGGVGFIPLVGEVRFLVSGVEHPPLAVAGIDVEGHDLDDFEQRDAAILLTAVGMSSQRTRCRVPPAAHRGREAQPHKLIVDKIKLDSCPNTWVA